MWFPQDPVLRAAALRWASAGPRALKAHIREGTELVHEVQEILLPGEVGDTKEQLR